MVPILQLPKLLRRIRSLLRTFFDFKVAEKASTDLKFCDFNRLFDVAFDLHQTALYVQFDPPRMRAMMAGGGSDLESFLLKEPLDIGHYRLAAFEIEQAVEKDEEANDDDRWDAGQVTEKAAKDLAVHILVWFIADISVAFVVNDPRDDQERQWSNKALKRLVRWSTNPVMRDTLGDPLTDAMRPIYWTPDALVKFGQAGGLAALFGDWVGPDFSSETRGPLN